MDCLLPPPSPTPVFSSCTINRACHHVYQFIELKRVHKETHISGALCKFRHFIFHRSATGEDWHKIMMHCFDDAKCDSIVTDRYEEEKCGSTASAIIYFCTFIFLCMFLVSDVA